MIESVLIVRDHGERKVYTWKFDGPKKNFKQFEYEMTKKHQSVYRKPNVEFVWCGWRGLGKR